MQERDLLEKIKELRRELEDKVNGVDFPEKNSLEAKEIINEIDRLLVILLKKELEEYQKIGVKD